jgi:hypothetical protein
MMTERTRNGLRGGKIAEIFDKQQNPERQNNRWIMAPGWHGRTPGQESLLTETCRDVIKDFPLIGLPSYERKHNIRPREHLLYH